MLAKISKAVGALAGAVTGVMVAELVEAVFQIQLAAPTANAIAVLIAGLGAYVAPKNAQ